jgi:hypothetical protein
MDIHGAGRCNPFNHVCSPADLFVPNSTGGAPQLEGRLREISESGAKPGNVGLPKAQALATGLDSQSEFLFIDMSL